MIKVINLKESEFEGRLAQEFVDLVGQDSVVGLTGGSTPVELYRMLDGTIGHFVVTDERFVPSSDVNSNWGMIQATLLAKIGAKVANVTYFDTDTLGWEDSAQKMESDLQGILKGRDYLFDLLMLGVGPDGHIASIFPDSPALSSDRLATTATTESFAVTKRLTLTLKALAMSKKVWLLLKGESKRPLLDLLQVGGELPVQRLLAGVDDVTVWFAT